MRFTRSTLASFAIAVAAATVLTACGGQNLSPAERLATPQGAMSARNDVDEPDLPLDRLPDETIVMPSRPTRAPQAKTQSNAAKLYVSPAETLPAVKALINNAEHSIYLQTFSFGQPGYGEQIVPLLIARAQKGLEVKVMMDYVGSRFLKGHKDMVKAMRDAGIEVRVYRPRTVIKDDKRIGVNITHRKVYLADGKLAYVGGVNLSAGFESTTEDLLIEWRGPVVPQLYREFAHDWKATKGGPLYQQAIEGAPAGNVDAQIVVTSPGEGRVETRDSFYAAIERATLTIDIAQQYLCDDGLIARLHDALKRGVHVRILVPGPEHGAIFSNLHILELKKLTDEGAEARLYHNFGGQAHLHTKYMAVDDEWALTGSVNFDLRALIENQELGIITRNPILVAQLKQRMFERDWRQYSQPFEYKEGSWVIKKVRNLLELIDYYL